MKTQEWSSSQDVALFSTTANCWIKFRFLFFFPPPIWYNQPIPLEILTFCLSTCLSVLKVVLRFFPTPVLLAEIEFSQVIFHIYLCQWLAQPPQIFKCGMFCTSFNIPRPILKLFSQSSYQSSYPSLVSLL